MPIRIGIATGTVAVLDGGLPVGAAILRADALSSYPPAGTMCVSKTFWMGRSADDRDRWKTVSRSVKAEHASMLAEAWVLELPDPQTPQQTPPKTQATQPPPPQPAPSRGQVAQPQPPQAGPAQNRLSLQQMIQNGLLNALVAAYPEQTSATMLLLAVGFPMHRIPPFQSSMQAWFFVCQQIGNGAAPGAFEPLLARAAQDYPHSRVFATYAR